MPKRVAITGATGFIGRAVCRLLHEQGWSVRALVRSEQGARRLAPWVGAAVAGDLEDHQALQRLVAGSDAVVHCAGCVRGADARAFDRVNVDGLRHLLAALREDAAPRRLLCLSSLAAREPRLSFYAASKRRAEQVLEQEAGALRWVALRPPAVYGPGDTELLPLFRTMARGVAPLPAVNAARFSVIFVDDLARAILAWLEQAPAVTGIYTLHDGTAGGYAWSDVCDAVARLCRRRVRQVAIPPAALTLAARLNRRLAGWLGYAPMLTPEKVRELCHPDWVCDNSALQAVLDWRPEVALEEGLRRTPGWCRRIDKVS